MNINMLKQVLLIAIVVSTIACSLIQKTKTGLKSNKFLVLYSLTVNILLSILFCKSFTNLNLLYSIWVGLFSFIGADTIFKALEGKLNSYSNLKEK